MKQIIRIFTEKSMFISDVVSFICVLFLVKH